MGKRINDTTYEDDREMSITGRLGKGDPGVECWVRNVRSEVDFDPENPWTIKVTCDSKVNIDNIGGQRGSRVHFFDEDINGINTGGIGCSITWEAYNGNLWLWDDNDTSSGWVSDTGAVINAKWVFGNDIKPHEIKTGKVHFYYGYIGYIYSAFNGWIPASTAVNQQFEYDMEFIMPKVVGGNSNNWSGNASRNNSFAYKTITFTANYSGFERGNADHVVEFWVGNSCIGTDTNNTSGTISGRLYIGDVGNKHWKLVCNGKTFAEGDWYFQEPPPSPPIMGGVNNTTWSSINTTRRKTLSASWWLDDRGWRLTQETYEWQCISSHYGLLKSGTTQSTSVSFDWDMPAKDVRDIITWKVRAKNSYDWSGWKSSSSVEVYWAYVEPTKISPIRVTPNRFQLFNGSQNTNINFDVFTSINAWGDRPGARNVEYIVYKNGTAILKNGKYETESTGTFKQNLKMKIPETELHQTYNIVAHKRLGNTEYSTSNDARFPTIGANRCTAGNVTFYEVIGRITGSIKLTPSIIISGIKTNVDYTCVYDKQSSEKVDVYIEVFRHSTKKVTDTFYLKRNESTSGTYKQKIALTLVRPQQADSYEIRLKATVTELLGNKHTYLLAKLTPDVYDPPIAEISLNNLSKPLPFDNATATLAKQATDITWNYNYRYNGVIPTKAIMTVTSKPYNTELFEIEYSDKVTPYYNQFTRVSKGDFALNTTVTAYMRLYYQIIGYSEVFNIVTNSVTIKITPTRYVYYLARVNIGEQQLNKIHQVVGKTDKTSKKIFITKK